MKGGIMNLDLICLFVFVVACKYEELSWTKKNSDEAVPFSVIFFIQLVVLKSSNAFMDNQWPARVYFSPQDCCSVAIVTRHLKCLFWLQWLRDEPLDLKNTRYTKQGLEAGFSAHKFLIGLLYVASGKADPIWKWLL